MHAAQPNGAKMRLSLAVAALATTAMLGLSTAARADDTTTTTTTTKTTDSPAVVVGVPGVVGVEVGHSTEGCVTKKTTTTDDETGDTVSKKTTNCD